MSSLAPSAVFPLSSPFRGKTLKYLYFLLILSVIPIGTMELNHNPENYPEDCFYNIETANCMKICRKNKELIDCYNKADETLSFAEKRKKWVHCSYLNNGVLRCFDYCQANPEYVTAKYAEQPNGECMSVKDPDLAFMDKCNENVDCIKAELKRECERMFESAQKRSKGNRDVSKTGIDSEQLKKDWDAYDNKVKTCADDLFDKYNACLIPPDVFPETSHWCFYKVLLEKFIKSCTESKPDSWTEDAWEDKCVQWQSKTICQDMCPHKEALRLCLHDLDKAGKNTCPLLKEAFDTCFTDCGVLFDPYCASKCHHKGKTDECKEYCKDVWSGSPSVLEECSAECEKRDYVNEVAKCKANTAEADSADDSNKATPRECLSIICRDFIDSTTGTVTIPNPDKLKTCIMDNCYKPLSQAEINDFCQNPQRVQIFKTCHGRNTPAYLQKDRVKKTYSPAVVVEAFLRISECETNYLKLFDEHHCLRYGLDATKSKVDCITRHADPITDEELSEVDHHRHSRHRDISCPRVDPPKIFELTTFANCRWKIDFAESKTPYKLWAHYFNELKASDIQEKLRKPDTTRFLDKTAIADGSKSYFVFPYFITIRGECEKGYGESFYRLIINGGYPLLTLQYTAVSNRAKVRSAMKIKFRTSLVNLDAVANSDDILPKRSQEELQKCHKALCYPAFTAPMVLLHIPVFRVTVSADDVFEELSTSVYVSTFHSRTIPGMGNINFANKDVTINPYRFFPEHRLSRVNDIAVDEYQSCVEQARTDCPPLYNGDYLPLSIDDLLSPSYTAGSAPVVVFAGFYAPNLLVLGDPDMKLFTYFEWAEKSSGSENNTIFEENTKCIFGDGRPMYSYLDIHDYDFIIKHYRIGYDKLNYRNGTESRAIFDVIAMEDRLLLVTLHGLVTLYGNSFETQDTNKLWTSDEEDKVRECFKFVRSARTAMMTSDVVVGITYGEETGNGMEKVFMGRLVESGKPLIWNQIVTHLDDYDERNLTEIEKICYKATQKEMANDDRIVTGFKNWCVALDATPVPAKENTIQVLVRMTIKKIKHIAAPVEALTDPKYEYHFFYIVASYTAQEIYNTWTIDSLLSRVPCVVDHKEAVQTIMAHSLQASIFSCSDDDKTENAGCTCHAQSGGDPFEGYLFLSHITYTRMQSSHMFLYGSTLLHSTDGGQSFTFLHAFEKVDRIKDPDSTVTSQSIVVMAFDDEGHFAFLTNFRELWYGSTGELKPIQLRPSPGYSMTQTVVSNIPGLKDAIPFSVMFDSRNNLFEMVAVVNYNNNEGAAEVTHILKRPVLVSQIFQNNHFVKKMEEASVKAKEKAEEPPKAATSLDHPLPKPLYENHEGSWSLFCPFSSPEIKEAYSNSYKRSQVFFLRPPIQHPSMGDYFIYESLMAYQAAAFGIVYKSLFDPEIEAYSGVGVDPIITWKQGKRTASQIGYLNWIRGETVDHGILIDPDDNKRELNESSNELVRFISLDYGIVVTYDLEFSIKDETSFALTSYRDQNIGLIQLNVDNANGFLLKINTERVRNEHSASVLFRIIMELNPNGGLPQSLPGQNRFFIPVVFHFIGGFGKCFKTQEKAVDNSVSLLVLAGCLDSTTIMFDWESTLRSINFRDQSFKDYGRQDQCYNGEFACFFARQAVKLNFEIFDLSRQVYKPFRGHYTMKVIAGGYSKNDMKKYTLEEQNAYNIPGVSDVSLIWTEWDEESNSKVKAKSAERSDEVRQIVLKSGESTIKWACHTLSPCARISPTIFGETVFWFRIAISNRGVDNETLCLYEREFDILLYGIPPSPELQLLITVLFCLIILSILYSLYYCCRSHKNVWRANKLKIVGWIQITKDSLPKRLKGITAASRAEDEALRKSRIIGSIQGHLQVPDLSEKALQDIEKGEQALLAKDNLDKGQACDAESLQSVTSSVILPAVNPHTGAGTWTDLVYEQIITKRLQAMVAKNKQMREGILRKVDLSRMKESLEHEDRFLSAHGSKASAEKAYQPPVFRRKLAKKDKKLQKK